jgi:hypothetical protein
MRASQLRLAKQLASFLQAALVVVSDLRDDVALGVIADLVLPDPECPCQWRAPNSGPEGPPLRFNGLRVRLYASTTYASTTGRSCATS